MGTWFWLCVPLMLLFLGCWAGIPAWHTLKRWDVELKAKHAELAARTAPQAVVAQPVPAMVTAARDRQSGLRGNGGRAGPLNSAGGLGRK